jgi:hypothetical protein
MIPAAVIVASLVGCDSSSPHGSPPSAPVDFATEDGGVAGAAVYLKGHVEAERVVVDVMARGAPDINGAAFRLHWDAAKLRFVEARGSDAWSRQAVLLAKEGAPGELVVAWTEKGSGAAIDAREDTRLGSIDFIMNTHDGAELSFRADRSKLVDAKGAPVAIAWRGGHVGAR